MKAASLRFQSRRHLQDQALKRAQARLPSARQENPGRQQTAGQLPAPGQTAQGLHTKTVPGQTAPDLHTKIAPGQTAQGPTTAHAQTAPGPHTKTARGQTAQGPITAPVPTAPGHIPRARTAHALIPRARVPAQAAQDLAVLAPAREAQQAAPAAEAQAQAARQDRVPPVAQQQAAAQMLRKPTPPRMKERPNGAEANRPAGIKPLKRIPISRKTARAWTAGAAQKSPL